MAEVEDRESPEIVIEAPGDDDSQIDVSARQKCIDDINNHLNTVGPSHWDEVRKRHPGVAARTFWRYVQRVRRGATGYTPEAKNFHTVIQRELERAQTAAISESIPVMPPPSIIASRGDDGRRKLDFLRHLDEMMEDCLRLRQWSMKPDKDGVIQIQNPMYYQQSIKLRAEVLNTAINAMKHLWDLTKMQGLYDAIIQEISHLDEKTGRAILERLRELDDERGMTFNARL